MEKHYLSADDYLRDQWRLAELVRGGCWRPDFLVGLWRGGAPVAIAVEPKKELVSPAETVKPMAPAVKPPRDAVPPKEKTAMPQRKIYPSLHFWTSNRRRYNSSIGTSAPRRRIFGSGANKLRSAASAAAVISSVAEVSGRSSLGLILLCCNTGRMQKNAAGRMMA